MPIWPELTAGGVKDGDFQAALAYISRLPIPRDRREGLLRLAWTEKNRVPTLAEIERVRSAASP